MNRNNSTLALLQSKTGEPLTLAEQWEVIKAHINSIDKHDYNKMFEVSRELAELVKYFDRSMRRTYLRTNVLPRR